MFCRWVVVSGMLKAQSTMYLLLFSFVLIINSSVAIKEKGAITTYSITSRNASLAVPASDLRNKGAQNKAKRDTSGNDKKPITVNFYAFTIVIFTTSDIILQ